MPRSVRDGPARLLPSTAVHVARTSLDYLQIGRWLARRHLVPARRVDTKQEVFDHLAGLVGDSPGLLYLEFGVWTGAILRWWSEHLPRSDARVTPTSTAPPPRCSPRSSGGSHRHRDLLRRVLLLPA